MVRASSSPQKRRATTTAVAVLAMVCVCNASFGLFAGDAFPREPAMRQLLASLGILAPRIFTCSKEPWSYGLKFTVPNHSAPALRTVPGTSQRLLAEAGCYFEHTCSTILPRCRHTLNGSDCPFYQHAMQHICHHVLTQLHTQTVQSAPVLVPVANELTVTCMRIALKAELMAQHACKG